MNNANTININLKWLTIPNIEKSLKSFANLSWPINWGYKIYWFINSYIFIPFINPKNNKVKINIILLDKKYCGALVFFFIKKVKTQSYKNWNN